MVVVDPLAGGLLLLELSLLLNPTLRRSHFFGFGIHVEHPLRF